MSNSLSGETSASTCFQPEKFPAPPVSSFVVAPEKACNPRMPKRVRTLHSLSPGVCPPTLVPAMLKLIADLSRSWLVEKGRTAAWHYARQLPVPGVPRELGVHVRAPGSPDTYQLRLTEPVDTLRAVTTFTEANSWARLELPTAPATVLDLGANNGFSSLYWQMRFPSAKVYGVEMDQRNFGRCETLFRENKLEPRFVRCAIAPQDGPITYCPHAEHGRHRLENLCEGDTRFAWKAETVTVPGSTLASFLDQHGLATVDLLKVDIEGAEQFLFDSIGAWATRVRFMLLEIHHNINPDEARRAVEQAGFENVGGDIADRTEWWCVNRRF